MVVGGGIGLIAVIAIIFGIFAGTASKTPAEVLSIAQQQTELIRIAEIGAKDARGTAAINLASTIRATLETDQASTTALLKKLNATADQKTLALGRNAATDALLTQAKQTNNFDEVFIQTMTTQLTSYQASIKRVYDSTDSKATKDLMKEQYSHAGLLIPTTQSSSTPTQ